MTTLTGQTVLVSGTHRGVGREYVTQLLDRGVTKMCAGARDPDGIRVKDPRVTALRLDVTDPASGLLINGAGIARMTSVLSTNPTASRE